MLWTVRDPTSPKPNEISISSKTVRPNELCRWPPTTWSPATDNLSDACSTLPGVGRHRASGEVAPLMPLRRNGPNHLRNRGFDYVYDHSISWHAVRYDGCRRCHTGLGAALRY